MEEASEALRAVRLVVAAHRFEKALELERSGEPLQCGRQAHHEQALDRFGQDRQRGAGVAEHSVEHLGRLEQGARAVENDRA